MSSSPQGNPFADWLKQQNPDYHREIEGDFDVDAALNAIQSHEGGSLGVKNPRTSATGYYQVMPKNIPIWTKEILGRAYTPEEFAADEDAQHKVARAKVKEYAAKHNGDMREVLHDWYGHGTPAEGETSVPDYIERGLKTYNDTIDKMDSYEKSMYEKYQAAQQAQSGMTPEQLAEIQAQQRAMGGNPDITGVPEKKGATDPNAPTGLEKTADWIGGSIRDTAEAGGTVLDAVGSAIGLPTKGQQEEAKVSGRSATGRDALPFGFEWKDGKIVAKKGLMERLSPGQATLDQANQWATETLKKRLGNPTDEEWKMLQEKFPGAGTLDVDEEGWKNYQKSAAEYNQAIFDAGRQALGMKGVPLTKDGHTDKEMAAIWAAGEAQTHKKPIGPNDVGLPLESVASVKKALDDYRLNNRGLMTKEQATESTKAFTTMLEQKAQESEKKAAELEAVGRTPEAEWYKKDAYDSRMQINQKVSGLQDYLDGLAFENVKDQLWNQHVQQYGKEADIPQERAKWEAGIHGNLTDLLSEVFKYSGPAYDMINYLTANRAVGEKGWADVAARNAAKPIAAFAREANLGIFNAPVTIINPDTGQPMEFDAGWLGDVPTSASDFAAERKQNQFERKGGKAGDLYSLASHGSEFTAGLAGTFAGFEGLTKGARALAGISDAAATRLAAAGVSEATTKLATGYARGLETFGKAIESSPEFAAVVESAGIGVATTAGRETVKVLRGIQTPQEAFVNTLKESPLEAANLLILLGPGKALSEIAVANLNEMKLGENVKNLVAEAGRTARVAAEAGASGEGAAALKEFLNLRKDLANSLKDIKLGDIRDRGLLLGGAAGMAAGQAGIRAVLSNQKPTYEQAATDIAFNLLGAKARPEGVVGVNEGIKRGVENNPIFGPAADGERGYGFGTKSGGEMAGDSAAKTREVMAQLGPENVKQGYTLLRDRQKKIIEAFDLRNDISPDQFRQRIRELHPEASPEQADGLSDALLDPKTTRKDLEAKLTDYENKIKGAEEAMKQPDVMEARSNVLLDQAAKKDAETQELVKHVLNQGEELAKQMEATAQEPMQNISALGEQLQRDHERLARGQKTYQDAMLLAKNAADTARQADETIKFLLAKQQTAIKNINDRYVADMIDGVPADGQMPPAVRERLDQMTAGLNQATLESAEAKKMADDYNNRLAEIQKELIDPAQKEIENTQKQLEEEGKKVEDVMANADKIREEHKKKAKEIQDAGDKAAQALEDAATKGYKDADARRKEIAKEALKKKEEEGSKLAGAREKDERKADRKAESEKKAEKKESKKAAAKKEAGKAETDVKNGPTTNAAATKPNDGKADETGKPTEAKATGKAAEPVQVTHETIREGDAIATINGQDMPGKVVGKPEQAPDGTWYVKFDTPHAPGNGMIPVDRIRQAPEGAKVEDTGVLGGRAGVKADILKQLHIWNDSPNLNFAKTGEKGEHVEKGGKRKKHSDEELDAFAESMTNMVEHVRKTLNNLVSHEDVGKFMFGPSGFKGEFMRFGGEKYVPHFTDTGVGLPGSGEGFGRKADAQAFMEGYLKEHPEDADRVKIAQAGGSAPSDKTYNHIFKQGSLATTMHEFGHRIRPLLKGEDQVLINNAFNRGSKDWDVAAEERFVKAMEFVNFTGELPDGVDPKVAGIIKNVSKVMRQLYAETSRFDDYGIAPDVKAFFQEMNHGIVRTVAEPERVRQILVAGGRPIIANSPPPANPGLSVIASANMNDPVIEGIDTTSLHATFDPNSKFTRLIKELPGLAAGLRDVSLGYGPVGVDTGFGRLNLTDPVAVRSAKEALRAKWNEAYKALLEQNEHLDPDTSKRILYWGLYNILRTPDDATVNFVLTSLEKTGAFKFATSAKAFEIGRRLSMGNAWLDAAEHELIRRGLDPVVLFGSPEQFSRKIMFDVGAEAPKDGVSGPNFSPADDGAVHITKDGEIYELDRENQAKLLNIIENQGKNKMSTLPKSDRIVPYGFKMDKATGWDGINREAYDDTVKLLAQKSDPNQHWAVKRKEAMTIEAGVKKHAETFKNMKTTTEPRHFAFIGPDGTGYARMPGDVTHRQTWSTAAGYKYDKYNYTSGKEADKQMSQFMDDTSTIRVADVGKSGVYLEVKKPLTDAQIKTLADKFFGLNISLSLTKRTFDFASVHVIDADIKSLKAANRPLAKAVKMENPYAVVDTVTIYGNNAKKVMFDVGGQPREKRQKPSDEEIARLREQKLAARREYVDSRPDMNPEEARIGFYSIVERNIPDIFGKNTELPASDVRRRLAEKGTQKEELRDLGLDKLFKDRGDKPVTRAEVETLMKANKLQVEENRLGGGPNVTQEQLAYRARITELQGLESDAKIPALRAVLKAYDFGNNATAEYAGGATSILNSLVDGDPNTDAERKLLETPEVQAYKKTRELRQNTEQKYRESDPAYALQKAQEDLAQFNETEGGIGYYDQAKRAVENAVPNLDPSDMSWYLSLIKAGTDMSGNDYTSGDRRTAKEIMELPAVKKYLEIEAKKDALQKAYSKAGIRAGKDKNPTHYRGFTQGALPYDPNTYTELLFKLPHGSLTHEESNRLADLHSRAMQDIENGLSPEEMLLRIEAGTAPLTDAEGKEYVRLLEKENDGSIKYSSSHFGGQDNLLAHGRFAITERDGKKYLQAMEVQSDWHQAAHNIRSKEVKRVMAEAIKAGKPITKGEAEKLVPQDFGWESSKKSFRDPDLILLDMHDASERIAKDLGFDGGEQLIKVGSDAQKKEFQKRQNADEELKKLNEELSLASRGGGKVADAPLKDVWHEFVLKAMIREAAARGLDGIIINGGKVNDDRYHLDQVASRIEYNPDTKELTAYGRDGSPLRNADHITVSEEKLPDWIGIAATDKLLESKRNWVEGAKVIKDTSTKNGEVGWVIAGPDGKLLPNSPLFISKEGAETWLERDSPVHMIEGESLRLKTPGMFTFYDEKIPNWLDKYVSRLGWDKMGVKGVEKIERDVAAEKKKAEEESGQIVYMPEANGKVEGDPDIHWKLDFPEKVVENIKTKGQPLYDLGAKGDKGVSASEPLPEGQSPFGHMTDEELIAAYRKLAFETEDMTRTAIKETEKERRDSIAEIISNFGKANLLSALGVHGTNLASNTLYAAFKISTEPVAAIIDMITAPYYKDPVTGKGMRTTVFGAGAGEFKAWKQAWLSAKGIDPNLEGKDLEKAILNQGGWNRAWREMWNTQPDSIREKMEGFGSGQRLRENEKMPSDAGNLEKVSKHFLGGVQLYSDVLFRALAAEDALFNIWHVRRSLESQARAMEKNGEGKYEDLMNDPTQRMIDIAEYEGMQATFNHRNWTSTQWAKIRGGLLKFAEQHHASAIKAYHEGQPFITAAQGGTAMFGKMAYIAADQIAPFVQTPTNILMRGLDMTPVGFAKGVVKLAEAKMALNAGLNAQLVGKQTDPNAEFQSMYKDAAFSLKRQGVHLIGESIGGAAIAYGIIHAMNAGYQKILVPYISDKEREAAKFSQMGGEGYGGNKLITPDIYVPFTGQVLLYSRTWDVSALGPPGAIIMAAGAYGKHIKEGPGWAAVAAGKALMLSMMNHPLIENTVDFYNWLSGDYEYTDKKGEVKEKPNMFAAGMGKRMIPLSGLAGNVAMMHDPFQRKQKTTLDAIQASIPGHGLSLGPLSFPGREDLDTKPSPLTGEPLENTRVPIFSTEKYTLNEPKNAVLKAVVTNRISPPTATPREGEKPEMAAKRKAMALKLFNEGVAKAIQSDKYKSLPDWDPSMEKRELGENESPKNKREYIMWFLKGLHMEKTMNELGFKPLKK